MNSDLKKVWIYQFNWLWHTLGHIVAQHILLLVFFFLLFLGRRKACLLSEVPQSYTSLQPLKVNRIIYLCMILKPWLRSSPHFALDMIPYYFLHETQVDRLNHCTALLAKDFFQVNHGHRRNGDMIKLLYYGIEISSIGLSVEPKGLLLHDNAIDYLTTWVFIILRLLQRKCDFCTLKPMPNLSSIIWKAFKGLPVMPGSKSWQAIKQSLFSSV